MENNVKLDLFKAADAITDHWTQKLWQLAPSDN